MTHVVAVDINTPTVKIDVDVDVSITVQPDLADLGDYDIVVYTSTSGLPGSWVARKSTTGRINPLGGPQVIPAVKIRFSSAGTYYVGAQDRGETSQGNPGFYDVVTVTPPIGPTSGYLTVSSNPSGAELYIDGNSKGLTPTGLEIAVGQHHILVSKDGYKPLEDYVTIVAGTTTVKNYTLAKSDEGDYLEILKKYAPWIIIGGIALVVVVAVATSGSKNVVYRAVGKTARGAYNEAKDAYRYVKEGWEEY